MVGVRRAVIAVLALALVAAGAVGWWLFTTESEEPAAAAATCAETVDGDTRPPEAGLLVCRYDAAGSLDRSALLAAGDVPEAEAALEAGVVGDPGCVAADPTPPIALLVTPSHRAVVALDQVCPTYTLDGGDPRRLTPEVRAWVQVERA